MTRCFVGLQTDASQDHGHNEMLHINVFHWDIRDMSYEPQSMYLLQAFKKNMIKLCIFLFRSGKRVGWG